MKKIKIMVATLIAISMITNTTGASVVKKLGTDKKTNLPFDVSDLNKTKELKPGFKISPDIDTKTKEEVSVIVELKGNPLKVKSNLKSVDETSINDEHSDFKDGLSNIKGYGAITFSEEIKFGYEFYNVFNGMEVKLPGNMVSKLAEIPQVKTVYKNYIVKLDNPTPAKEKLADSLPQIGADKLHDENINGQGIKVAVLDTGVDYNHPDIKDNYKGGYDYVDNDDNPMETTYEDWKNSKKPEVIEGSSYYTSHGTHVSGTIVADGKNTGNTSVVGVAPKADLYVYRVLGPYGSGATAGIIAAIDKAVEEKMDIMSLSLGSSINDPLYPTSVALNNAAKAGTIPVVAAANAGPNRYTLGSPGTSPLAITVGASNSNINVPTVDFKIGDNNVFSQLLVKNFDEDIKNLSSKEFNYEFAGLGKVEDFKGLNLKGKFALIKRGELALVEKVKNAKDAGAMGVILINNVNAPFEMFFGDDKSLTQTFVISIEDGEKLLSSENKTKKIIFGEVESMVITGDKLADFSSRGPVSGSFDIKPDIVAPGVNVLSTYPEYINSPEDGIDYSTAYARISGTSMATPHISGVVALMLQEARKAGKNLSTEDVKAALMNTAVQLDGSYSVYEEGAGRVNAYRAVKDEVSIKVNRETQTVEDEKVVNIPYITGSLFFGNLKNDGTDQKSTKAVSFTNNSGQAKKFKFNVEYNTGINGVLDNKENNVFVDSISDITLNSGDKKDINISINVPKEAKFGTYEGFINIVNVEDNHETYRIPFAVKTINKGFGFFDMTKYAFTNDTSEPTMYIQPFTGFSISTNSQMKVLNNYIKDAKTGNRIGYVQSFDGEGMVEETQYTLDMAWTGYYFPMIGDYVKNQVVLADEGQYKFEIEGIDSENNKYSVEKDVFIDNTAPKVTLDNQTLINSLTDSDYTVEDGIEAYYVHGKVQDDIIDKLNELGYKTDMFGNKINQGLNLMTYYQFEPSERDLGYPTGYLRVGENGDFKYGIGKEEIVDIPQQVLVFPYDYSSSAEPSYETSRVFRRNNESIALTKYDKAKIVHGDEVTQTLSIGDINDAKNLSLSIAYPENGMNLESVKFTEGFNKLLDSKNLKGSIKQTLDNGDFYEKKCNVEIEISGDAVLDIKGAVDILDTTFTYTEDLNIGTTVAFAIEGFKNINTSGVETKIYTVNVNNFRAMNGSTTIDSFIFGEGLIDEEFNQKPLDYTNLGIKAYIVDNEGKEYLGEIDNGGQVIIKNIPIDDKEYFYVLDIPGHFTNKEKVVTKKFLKGEWDGIFETYRLLTLPLAGDLNKDNIINKEDRKIIEEAISKQSREVMKAEDLNKDGKVNSEDLAMLDENIDKVNPCLVNDIDEEFAYIKQALTLNRLEAIAKKLNSFPSGALKDKYQKAYNEYNYKYNLNIANEAVLKAEKSKIESDYIEAKGFVNSLADGNDKTLLLERLNNLYNEIYLVKATNLVEKAELSYDENIIKEANDILVTLKVSNEKTALVDRITKLSAIITEAKKLVSEAETAKTKEAVDKAKEYVNNLKDSDFKVVLLEKINNIKILPVNPEETKPETKPESNNGKIPYTGGVISNDEIVLMGILIMIIGAYFVRRKDKTTV